MILLLGIVAATRVPVQMIPDLETRVIFRRHRLARSNATRHREKRSSSSRELYLRTLPKPTTDDPR